MAAAPNNDTSEQARGPHVATASDTASAEELRTAKRLAEFIYSDKPPHAELLKEAKHLGETLPWVPSTRTYADESLSDQSSIPASDPTFQTAQARGGPARSELLQTARQMGQLLKNDQAAPGLSLQKLRFLNPFLMKRLPLVAATVILTLLVSAITIPVPLIQMRMIDDYVPSGKAQSLLVWAGFLLALYVGGLIAKLLLGYTSSKLNSTLLLDLKAAVFERVMSLPLSFFSESHSSYLATRVNEVDRAGTMLSMSVMALVVSLLTFTFSAALLLALEWRLFAIALLLSVPQYFFLKRFTGGIRQLSATLLEKSATISQSMQEVFAGMSTVKAFAAEGREAEKLATPLAALFNSSFLQSLAVRSSADSLAFLSQITFLAVLVGGMLFIIWGEMTIGRYVAAVILVERMLSPIQALATAGLVLQPSLVALNRVSEYCELATESGGSGRNNSPSGFSGMIEFRNVGFSYPNKEAVLKDVSFTIHSGEIIALTGANGSGKTTLVKLLLQLHLPLNGAIYLDGLDAATINLGFLRRRIGVVSQDAFVFNDTILNNLVYGGIPPAKQELDELVARCCPFVETLPHGLQTRVGEGGAALSGGQKQAISIARALLKKSDILVVDEGSAHLDAVASSTLQRSIRESLAGKTCLLITHDPSLVAVANRVIHLEGGTISERDRRLTA